MKTKTPDTFDGKKSVLQSYIHNDDNSLMGKMMCFLPDKRPGYTGRLRRENTIARRVSFVLYHNRELIASDIVYNHDKGYDMRTSCIKALEMNHISIHSVDGWLDYVQFLTDREGGWKKVIARLRKELSFTVRYREAGRISAYTSITIMVVFLAMYAASSVLFGVPFFFIVGMTPAIAHTIISSTMDGRNKKRDRDAWIGSVSPHILIPWSTTKRALRM